MREQELEDFLATNPYLIDHSFDGLRPSRQLAKDGNRLDLLIQRKTTAVIVELKRGPLDESSVLQLERYYTQFSSEVKLARRHFLVGREPTVEQANAVQSRIRDLPFKVTLRILGKHIPLRLLYDSDTRKYIPYDPQLSRLPQRYSQTMNLKL